MTQYSTPAGRATWTFGLLITAAVMGKPARSNAALQLFGGSSGSGTAMGPFAFASDAHVTSPTGITLTALGLFDDGSPGSLNPSPSDPAAGSATTGSNGSVPANGLSIAHQVAVYDASNDVLLAEATIPAGTAGTLSDGYRFASISPLFIPGNTDIAIVGYDLSDATATGTPMGDDYGEATKTLSDNGLTLFRETFSQTNQTSGVPMNQSSSQTFAAGNIQFVTGNAVPDPATVGAGCVAAAATLLRRRRRHLPAA